MATVWQLAVPPTRKLNCDDFGAFWGRVPGMLEQHLPVQVRFPPSSRPSTFTRRTGILHCLYLNGRYFVHYAFFCIHFDFLKYRITMSFILITEFGGAP